VDQIQLNSNLLLIVNSVRKTKQNKTRKIAQNQIFKTFLILSFLKRDIICVGILSFLAHTKKFHVSVKKKKIIIVKEKDLLASIVFYFFSFSISHLVF